jgi:hypothetical protein
MQQQLRDRAAATDGAFRRELLLQRLPANMWMALTSATETTSLKQLARLADRTVEAAPSSVAATNLTSDAPTEVEQLRAAV